MSALQTAIDDRDAAAIAAALHGVDERQRASWHTSIAVQLENLYGWADRFPSLCLARLGTAPDVAAASAELFHAWPLLDQDAAYEILVDRDPPWLAALVDELPAGRLRRRLIAAGHGGPRPDLVTARAVVFPFGHYRWKPPLVESLVADGIVLTDDIFTLFAAPEIGQWLSNEDVGFDKPHPSARAEPDPDRTWRVSLARLARSGHVDLARLLAGCLGVFTKDARVSDLSWFSRLHAELKPTVDEMRPHADTYVRLLAAQASFAVGLAQKALSALVAADAADPRAVVDASEAPMHRPEKTLVVGQVRLLGAIANRHPGLRDDVVARLALALEHERTDVQEAALVVITRHGGLADAAVDAATVSPVLATEARAAGLSTTSTPAPTGEFDAEIVALAARITALPTSVSERFGLRVALERLRRGEVAAAVAFGAGPGAFAPPPVEDPEELVEVMSDVLEDPADALGIERILGGAVRTARLPLDDRARLGAAVARRARALIDGEWTQHTVAGRVATVVHCWATGRPAPDSPTLDTGRAPAFTLRSVFDVLWARTVEVQWSIVHGTPAALLAEPTRATGAVDASVLLQRLARRHDHGAPLPVDLEVAALRLDRDLDDTFWTEAVRIDPASAATLRTVWESAAPVRVQPLVAVVPPRNPWLVRDTEVTGQVAVDAPGDAAGVVWPLLVDHRPTPDAGTYYEPVCWLLAQHLAGWALLTPWQPEVVAALTLRGLASAMYPSMTAAPEAAAALGILDGLETSWGPAAHLALALGTLGYSADVRAAAGEALAVAATAGRLDAAQLAASWVTLAEAGAVKYTRLVATLRPITGDPIVGHRVLEALNHASASMAASPARDVNALLALANELAARFGFDPVPAITALAARGGSTRRVVEARRLAAYDGSPGPERPAAAVAHVRGLLAQAEAMN